MWEEVLFWNRNWRPRQSTCLRNWTKTALTTVTLKITKNSATFSPVQIKILYIHAIHSSLLYSSQTKKNGTADTWTLTLTLLTWTIWRAPTNASKWRMGFNSAFKGLTRYYSTMVCDAALHTARNDSENLICLHLKLIYFCAISSCVISRTIQELFIRSTYAHYTLTCSRVKNRLWDLMEEETPLAYHSVTKIIFKKGVICLHCFA